MAGARPDTWMPMYWGDYARDTGHLNAAGHGAYLMLIKHYWCTGAPLIDDDDELWRIACCDSKRDWLKLRPKIVRLFKPEGGLLRHKRVEEELSNATSNVSKKVEAGQLGGRAKWGAAAEGSGATRSQRLAEARRKGTHTPAEWDALVAVFDGRCVRCGASPDRVLKDHIQPIYQGGSDAIENLQPLCRTCNTSKGPEAIDHRGAAVSDWRERMAERLEVGAPASTKTPGERLANVRQMPATSPSPSPIEANPQQGTTARAPAGPEGGGQKPAPDPRHAEATRIIAAFDAARAETWGEAMRRPFPAPKDFNTALAWIDAGANANTCRDVFAEVNARLADRGMEPPDTLAARDRDVRAAIARLQREDPGDMAAAGDDMAARLRCWCSLVHGVDPAATSRIRAEIKGTRSEGAKARALMAELGITEADVDGRRVPDGLRKAREAAQ